ncbi:heme-binding protein [Salinimonas marina]|uniref:Heme-binding protein n=1 Tax=Salinimonas marina TaxID=2785918 RepID=A0A7S9DWC7_9ALTE|nr:heme-binding protein [Salinimonas marina]QPG04450.1 heme-binding protein [Salinimonas marina]
MKKLLPVLVLILMSGCSLVGKNDVKTVPYTIVKASKDKDIELREYPQMVLVSTSMVNDEQGAAFKRLFNYISGANNKASNIEMTAPVLMSTQQEQNNKPPQRQQIEMTAPVLMHGENKKSMMSFVMPRGFTRQSTPEPTNPEVWVDEITNLKVAAITFSGTLSEDNKLQYTRQLKEWLSEQDVQIQGDAFTAAYNGPFTLPAFRRNEILIEVK